MSIKIKNLSISVNDNHLVSIPYWNLENGKVYGLCGETGSGKSTIGRWLANLAPKYWSVEGMVESNPIPAVDFETSTTKLRSLNSNPPLYLLQDAYQIFNPYVPILTHFKDIWKDQENNTSIKSFDDIVTLLIRLGIDDPESLLLRKIHQVSQGEAQRLAFVLGLIRPAAIRIYDEVFSNVDEKASRAMLAYLSTYCANTNSLSIVISHETNYLQEYMDETYQIREGILDEIQVISSELSPIVPRSDHPPFIDILDLVLPSFLSTKTRKNELYKLPEFSVCLAESVGIYGNSGVGKSTFLKSLLGEHPLNWLKCRITKNDSIYYTTDLSTLDIRYLPQSVISAFNPANPIKTSLAELQSTYQVDHEELQQLLERFTLKKVKLEKYPNELSGGEIQRIGIISALMGNPDLILLDESFSSVDNLTREVIWNVLMEEQIEKLISLVVVSHDIDWLKSHMNRIYEMKPSLI